MPRVRAPVSLVLVLDLTDPSAARLTEGAVVGAAVVVGLAPVVPVELLVLLPVLAAGGVRCRTGAGWSGSCWPGCCRSIQRTTVPSE